MQVKTAVIYARFSCSKQREASIDDQLRVCRKWCACNGYAIVQEYTDYAMTGTNDERPAFRQMIGNAGESDIVLVYMMDRFSRDEYDAPIYKKKLAKKGVEVLSATETLPDGPERILVEKIYEGLAAVESKKISIRTSRGMEGNALKCMTNGVRVFGYRKDENDRYAVNGEEAALVREAFRRRIDGESVNHIASDFRLRGVKSAQGRPCSYNMMQTLLANERYTGVYKWGDVRVEGGMPQIIDPDTFRKAQNAVSRKQRFREDWSDYALSGRVTCSECGNKMVGTSGRGHSHVKYEYYSCKRCKGVKPVRKDWLESGIAEALRDMLEDDSVARRIANLVKDSAKDDYEAATRMARKSLREAENGLANILDAIQAGVKLEGLQQRIDELEAQKARAEEDLRGFEEEAIDIDDFVTFLQFGATLDDAALLDAFVKEAVVSCGEIVVTLNFDQETGEPAILDVQRVRPELVWLPIAEVRRTVITVTCGNVLIRFDRAA